MTDEQKRELTDMLDSLLAMPSEDKKHALIEWVEDAISEAMHEGHSDGLRDADERD